MRPEGAVCRCGSRGCLETVASTGALLSLLRPTHGPDLTLSGMLELVTDGDLPAKRVVNDAGRAVGRALADLCNHLNPAAIVVGGDLSLAGDALLDGVREEIERYSLPEAAQAAAVKPGSPGRPGRGARRHGARDRRHRPSALGRPGSDRRRAASYEDAADG